MKKSHIVEWALVAAIIFLVLLRQCENRPTEVRYEYTTDTVTVRDTIRIIEPHPVRVTVLRYDTAWLYKTDTIVSEKTTETGQISTVIPIERKEYKTDDYRAVVEGFRPNLVEIELYRKRTVVTNTEKRTIDRTKRMGIGIQIGYGLSSESMAPYIGVGISYNLIGLF